MEERTEALEDPTLGQHGFVPLLVDTPTVRTVTDALDKQ